jgi:hypothetical protein
MIMKKLVLVLAIVFAGVMSANAQVWVGLNNIHAAIEKNHTGIGFAPEIGYNINNQWTIALGLNYELNQTEFGGVKTTTNEMYLQPYVRYIGGTIGHKFSLFVDLCGDFALLDADGYAVTLQPGIAWAATEKFTAAFRFCKIGYDHHIYETDGFLLKGALACPGVGIYYSL